MSTENEALLHRWFDEVWNKKRASAIDELMEPDCLAHGMGPNGSSLRGSDQFKAMHATFCGAFPDLEFTLGPVVANDDMTACQFVAVGTHGGDHLGIAATGKPVTIRGMTIARYEHGKVVEGWNTVDFLPAFTEIGLVRSTLV